MTKRQHDRETKWQKDKKRKDNDQKESLMLWRQGSFALLRCFKGTSSWPRHAQLEASCLETKHFLERWHEPFIAVIQLNLNPGVWQSCGREPFLRAERGPIDCPEVQLGCFDPQDNTADLCHHFPRILVRMNIWQIDYKLAFQVRQGRKEEDFGSLHHRKNSCHSRSLSQLHAWRFGGQFYFSPIGSHSHHCSIVSGQISGCRMALAWHHLRAVWGGVGIVPGRLRHHHRWDDWRDSHHQDPHHLRALAHWHRIGQLCDRIYPPGRSPWFTSHLLNLPPSAVLQVPWSDGCLSFMSSYCTCLCCLCHEGEEARQQSKDERHLQLQQFQGRLFRCLSCPRGWNESGRRCNCCHLLLVPVFMGSQVDNSLNH